ncbi:MAG: LD-carboxypeptidase [Cyclobacteriaceae bacterium]
MIPLLKKSDKVIILSTARKVSREEMNLAKETMHSWGLELSEGINLYKEDYQFAGTDEQRLSDLQQALDDVSIKAIFFARGGYGTSRLVDQLDWAIFNQSPKWLVGFSDVTILHTIVNNHGVPSIHGTMPILFENKIAVDSLKGVLFGGENKTEVKPHLFNRLGEATAPIVGGNLTLLIHGLGTPTEINTDGKILFIEEIDEYLYHIDRMILQLKRAGKLSQLKGLIVGGFSQMNDNPIPFGKLAYEIIQEHTAEYDYPVLYDFPAGHVEENQALILGKNTLLSVTEDSVSIEQ